VENAITGKGSPGIKVEEGNDLDKKGKRNIRDTSSDSPMNKGRCQRPSPGFFSDEDRDEADVLKIVGIPELKNWILEAITNLGNIASEIVYKEEDMKPYVTCVAPRAKLMTMELAKRASSYNYRTSRLQNENARLRKRSEQLEKEVQELTTKLNNLQQQDDFSKKKSSSSSLAIDSESMVEISKANKRRSQDPEDGISLAASASLRKNEDLKCVVNMVDNTLASFLKKLKNAVAQIVQEKVGRS